jgi:hypothetical protein
MNRYYQHIISISLLLSATLFMHAQAPSLYKVARVPVSESGFSEISPVITHDGLMFCSDRRFSSIKDRTSYSGNRLYNFYIAERTDSAHWGKSKEIKSERSTLFNNGPLCIAPDGKTVYFTSEVETGNIAKNRKFKNHNGIFIAQLSGDGLNDIKPFKFNNQKYNVGQPSISRDGKYLFFSSDMPGSIGKSDIYYCEMKNGEWSDPVNPGPIVNSPGAENFPFAHPSGKLYFSSDRSGGKGRMDVYSTSLFNGKWEIPVLLPEPVNSRYDDFSFVISDNLQTGYFSSNRVSDDDIFTFTSTIIRLSACDTLQENSYCYQFLEENAAKLDSVPFLFQWKFSDGHKAEGAVVEHCFEGPGKYIVQLDVVNMITKEVIYNEKTDTILVEDIIQPYISVPDRFTIGENIKLDASGTNLPGWDISRYYWNFDDESVAVGTQVTKKYTRPGTYEIQLIITGKTGENESEREACVSKKIEVLPAP